MTCLGEPVVNGTCVNCLNNCFWSSMHGWWLDRHQGVVVPLLGYWVICTCFCMDIYVFCFPNLNNNYWYLGISFCLRIDVSGGTQLVAMASWYLDLGLAVDMGGGRVGSHLVKMQGCFNWLASSSIIWPWGRDRPTVPNHIWSTWEFYHSGYTKISPVRQRHISISSKCFYFLF